MLCFCTCVQQIVLRDKQLPMNNYDYQLFTDRKDGEPHFNEPSLNHVEVLLIVSHMLLYTSRCARDERVQ